MAEPYTLIYRSGRQLTWSAISGENTARARAVGRVHLRTREQGGRVFIVRDRGEDEGVVDSDGGDEFNVCCFGI